MVSFLNHYTLWTAIGGPRGQLVLLDGFDDVHEVREELRAGIG